MVVLVSHGDALQLLQTAFQGVSPSEHRSLPHLHPGELRELCLLDSGRPPGFLEPTDSVTQGQASVSPASAAANSLGGSAESPPAGSQAPAAGSPARAEGDP